jgi:hypothetical protein
MKKLMSIVFEELETKPAGEDPPAAPVDPTPSGEGDTPPTATPEPTDPPEDPVLPDKQYTLDEVNELIEKQDISDSRKKTPFDEAQSLIGVATSVSQALESLEIYGDPNIVCKDPLIRSAIRRMGGSVALESFDLKTSAQAMMRYLKELLKRIIEAIKKGIVWAHSQVRAYTSLDRLTADSVKRATEAFLVVRKADKYKLDKAAEKKLIDVNNYCDVMMYKRWLTVDGVQPNGELGSSYASEMARVLEIIKLQQHFSATRLNTLVEAVKTIAESIHKGEKIDDISKVFDPAEFVLKGCTQMAHYDGYTPSSDRSFWVYDGLLGSVAFCNEFPRHPEPSAEYTALNKIGEWRCTFKTGDATMNNGSLRLLRTEEVVEASKVVTALADAIDAQKEILKAFEFMAEAMKKVMDELEQTVSSRDDLTSVAMYEYAKLAQACNSIIRNGTTIVDATTTYARKTMYAWGLYLTATTKKDMEVIAELARQQ